MRKTLIFSVAVCGLALALILVGVPVASAKVQCVFDRGLQLGDEGEDVRCLQQYLNDAGVIISTEGAGSPGSETTLFRGLTEEALADRQRHNTGEWIFWSTVASQVRAAYRKHSF